MGSWGECGFAELLRLVPPGPVCGGQDPPPGSPFKPGCPTVLAEAGLAPSGALSREG